MFDDTDPPLKSKGPKVLDTLSIAELEDYVTALEAEIGRVQTAIAAKRAHAQAAAGFFKSGG
jgi:uncharacterized small protein (DUF1192 family)